MKIRIDLQTLRRELMRRSPYLIQGRRVTSTNRYSADFRIITEACVVWYGIILDLAESVPVYRERKDLEGRYFHNASTAVLSIFDTDLTVSFSFLDEVTNQVLNAICPCPGTFKGCQLPVRKIKQISKEKGVPQPLCNFVIMAMKHMLAEENPEGDHGSCLRNFLYITRFLKKLPISRDDLIEGMEADYIAEETRLSEVVSHFEDPEVAKWIDDLNRLAIRTLKGFKVETLCPRHGPGRVYEDGVTTAYDKFHNMQRDDRVAYMLSSRGLGTQDEYCPWVQTHKSKRTARYLCVPKTWKTLRGISAEPTELQFYQQAVLFCIDQMFKSDPFWSKRIDLHDQVYNQRDALKGSLDQSLATIDLSKASDSVSLDLVKKVFKGTELLPWLLATRSTGVELPSGCTLKTKKFAPMGSSTCFPVECIIFCLIAEVARYNTRDIPGCKYNPRMPRVYGDDIVCDSTTVPEILKGLSLLGFLPNEAKSYWTGFFRESCGKEYWCGQDVSPLYYRAEELNPDAHVDYRGLSSIIMLYNSLQERGLTHSRRYVLSSIMAKVIRMGKKDVRVSNLLVRTFSGDAGTIRSCEPTNFQCKLQFGDDLQCRLVTKLSWYRKYCRNDIDNLSREARDEVLLHLWFLEKERQRILGTDRPEKEEPDPYARMPVGYEMLPSIKKVPYWFYAEGVI